MTHRLLRPGTMLRAFSDVQVKSCVIGLYKLLHSGFSYWSPNIVALQTSTKLYMKNVPSTSDLMQFNSGGLEAMLEANRVAMEPSGAVLLPGQQLGPFTLLLTASYSASYCQLLC